MATEKPEKKVISARIERKPPASTITLRCLAPHGIRIKNVGWFKVGDVFVIEEKLGRRLLEDLPAKFEEVDGKTPKPELSTPEPPPFDFDKKKK